MKPRLLGLSQNFFVILVFCVGGNAQFHEIERNRSDDFDYPAGKRTFIFGKLVLVTVLAAIGLKFLALLPIVLSKIVLLSIMNFLSTNLNLLVSTLFGMKNFLGKYGLWAQEDTKRHPELETFAEFANQPIPQPSFRYQYIVDKESSLGSGGTTKAPRLRVFNNFISSDSGSYKQLFDKKIKINDKRHLLKSLDQTITKGQGKYKCYWVNDDVDSGMKFGLGDSVIKQEEIVDRRRFGVMDIPISKSH